MHECTRILEKGIFGIYIYIVPAGQDWLQYMAIGRNKQHVKVFRG